MDVDIVEPPKYDIIVADPPWKYPKKNKMLAFGNKIEPPYPCVSTASLCAMGDDIKKLCKEDCVLYMWTTSTHMPDALQVMKDWGFKYVNVAFVWDKVTTNMGGYTMPQYEFVLYGKKGKAGKVLDMWTGVRQKIEEKKTKHSAKPLAFWERIGELSHFDTRTDITILELFARQESFHPRHDVWGNEVNSRIELKKLIKCPEEGFLG